MPRSDIHKDGLATRFKAQGDIPPGGELAKRPLTVKVLAEVDTAIRELPEMSAWLRRVITEAATRELLGTVPDNQESPHQTDDPLINIRKLVELRGTLEKVLATEKIPLRYKRLFMAVVEALGSL